ncbi:hypothetical protein [Bacillus sp. B-jedd]|uniref:hypothetical protein n=1 Tax=Bacillus sp. B-jedd TaxID=1476857 RepID=UPI0005155C91|nr:hypothetical protein [Bacillus sp. B-jedd]CEG02206.1 hypothetical protein BN1002_04783 [Bacillus sp. B-jedd]
MDMLRDFFNPYERQARLYPALISLFPTFAALYSFFDDLRGVLSTILGSVFFVGISYLFGKLTRELGKKKQDSLIVDWDGMPSTRFLRHVDTTIDPLTKKRYHQFLEKNIADFRCPTPEEESSNKENADKVYDSGIKWLLAKTRDTQKYSLLFRENISYGFARNFWALKPWSLLINSIILFGSFGLMYQRHQFDFKNVFPLEWVSISITTFIIISQSLITKNTVHSKAKAYARTLLEVCDE